jgi:hypothetical protein
MIVRIIGKSFVAHNVDSAFRIACRQIDDSLCNYMKVQMMKRYQSEKQPFVRLMVVVALISWGLLLFHVLHHHDEGSNHCLLCHSAQLSIPAITPVSAAVLVLFAFVYLGTAKVAHGHMQAPTSTRAPPCDF